MVRLYSLDDCRRFFGNTAQPPEILYMTPITLGGTTDREHRSFVGGIVGSVGIRENQLIDEMVEGRSQIMDAVSEQQTDDDWRLWQHGNEVREPRFEIDLRGGAAITTHVSTKTTVCDFQMFLCPDEFPMCAIERRD